MNAPTANGQGSACAGDGGATKRGLSCANQTSARAGDGFALPIALLVVVAISLAAAQMVRAVDTTTAVAGNLVLRAETIATAGLALEQALGMLEDPAAIPDRDHDLAERGYHASRLAGEDPRGIPRALQGRQVDASVAGRQPAVDGTTMAHVIERLCLAPGPALLSNCLLARPPGTAAVTGTTGTTAAGATPPPPDTPIYRVTARVDGPRGAIVVVQAHALGVMPPQRLSWRIVAE